MGGLLIGALFSFIVNVFTIQIQESVAKQRILEAVEYEIFNNTSQAGSIIKQSQQTINKNENPNPFFTFQVFTRDLWEQSTEPLQYIAQLPSDIQSEIVVYYTVTIPRNNEMISKIQKYVDQNLSECFPIEGSFIDKNKEEFCRTLYNSLLDNHASSAKNVFDEGLSVLDKFHPTQDRLNSRWLRLLMGSDSVRVLSRK